MKYLICLIAMVTFATACKKDDKNYSYSFDENGCKTGTQNFKSQGDLCLGLQNETLNHGCAEALRAQEFEKSCPGQTFTPNNFIDARFDIGVTPNTYGSFPVPATLNSADFTYRSLNGDFSEDVSLKTALTPDNKPGLEFSASCAVSETSAREIDGGLRVLSGARVALVQNTELATDITALHHDYTFINCDEGASLPLDPSLYSQRFALGQGQTVTESMRTLPSSAELADVDVSCVSDLSDLDQRSGILLLPQTRVLVTLASGAVELMTCQ